MEGDTNSNFFHLVANGRRRKKKILSLDHEGELLPDPAQIQSAIYTYYKKLFGIQPLRTVKLAERVWEDRGRLSSSDIDDLLRPFTEDEVKKVVFGMKENTAPGPDGFSVTFYKQCWEFVKGELMRMIHDFYMGSLDIGRLNYGVITLVPKVKDANNVKQFRPICLLNVSFKIFTKLLMDRLAAKTQNLIAPSQTAFIKGRYIVDGVVMLHEVVHELHAKKMQGVLFKIDF